MEINKFIIFLIIIIFSIIIYKCAKIFNLKKTETYINFHSQFGFNDSTGYVEKNVDDLGDTTYLSCKGAWDNCSSTLNVANSTNGSSCQKTYIITNQDNYLEECKFEHGQKKNCIPDMCKNIDSYIFDGTTYEIMNQTSLIHYKRKKFDDAKDIQLHIDFETMLSNEGSNSEGSNSEGSNSEGSNSEGSNINGDDSQIQLTKLIQIMNKYKNDENFIGLIKHDILGGFPKFYPIILDDDSEYDIINTTNIKNVDIYNNVDDIERKTLYLKQNINCRGRWEDCRYYDNNQGDGDIGNGISERKYIIKTGHRGSGSVCDNKDDDVDTCAKWSWGCKTIIDLKNEKRNAKSWEIINDICDNPDQDCSNNTQQHYFLGDCTQTKDCQVTWGECINGSNGKRVKKATIESGARNTGSGACAYKDGEEYHSNMEMIYGSAREIGSGCKDGKNLVNCLCNKNDFKPCDFKTRIYWGNDLYNVSRPTLNNLPNNEIDPTKAGNCWLQIYNYKQNTSEKCTLGSGLVDNLITGSTGINISGNISSYFINDNDSHSFKYNIISDETGNKYWGAKCETKLNKTGPNNYKIYSDEIEYNTNEKKHFKEFSQVNNIQTFIIPVSGSYTFIVKGARGGGSSSAYRRGAIKKATFELVVNQILQISVGEMGKGSVEAGQGGGGGSFVWIRNAAEPLMVAGGGGGDGYNDNDIYNGGNATNTGGTGLGGNSGGWHRGGGGGGWKSKGINPPNKGRGAKGGSIKGGAGGAGDDDRTGDGGWGGGGSGGSLRYWSSGINSGYDWSLGGGGGGGYTGGHSGSGESYDTHTRMNATGGTSYINPSNTNTETLIPNLNEGNDGSVKMILNENIQLG